MEGATRLLSQRRFLPLFITQFLGAFNDNLFKLAMISLVTFHIYNDPKVETQFSGLCGALFILPFFLLSAVSGQLADGRDKARLIRLVKTAEIIIMLVGAAGLLLKSIPLMLLALFAMGVHSTFFGPIKYAILPQHLDDDHVLAGTGLVEAGTYIAILGGTVIGGLTGTKYLPVEWAAAAVIGVAVIGRIAGNFVPDAPPHVDANKGPIDIHIVRASIDLVRETAKVPRIEMAIIAISFFWAIGAVLAAQFPPLVKNALSSDQTVATIFLGVFSVGVAIGSVAVNRLLKGHVSARYSPISVIVMGLFVMDLWWGVRTWAYHGSTLTDWREFLSHFEGKRILFDLFGISIAGGMFVVPLYAFLTITVPKSETARTIAANNIINSGFMVAASIVLIGLTAIGVTVADTLLMVAIACLVAAWIAQKLHKLCD
jgi:MFS family permease